VALLVEPAFRLASEISSKKLGLTWSFSMTTSAQRLRLLRTRR